MEQPRVWTDPELCNGCGNCSRIAPSIFKLNDAGVSVVHLKGVEMAEEGVSGRELEEHEVAPAIQAVEECPGEIIVVEW